MQTLSEKNCARIRFLRLVQYIKHDARALMKWNSMEENHLNKKYRNQNCFCFISSHLFVCLFLAASHENRNRMLSIPILNLFVEQSICIEVNNKKILNWELPARKKPRQHLITTWNRNAAHTQWTYLGRLSMFYIGIRITKWRRWWWRKQWWNKATRPLPVATATVAFAHTWTLRSLMCDCTDRLTNLNLKFQIKGDHRSKKNIAHAELICATWLAILYHLPRSHTYSACVRVTHRRAVVFFG